MTQSFKCASCSAPLEFEGKTMQKCEFCGSTVIVPPSMFYGAGTASYGDLSSLTGKALAVAEIEQLIQAGNKIEAIKLFRETFGVGLKEAKDAVEAMERGEGVDISGMQIRTATLSSNPQNLEAAKKIGFAIGGSMLAVFAIIAVIIVGVVAAILFFVSSTVDRAIDRSANSVSVTQTPKPAPEKPQDTTELLRFGGDGTGAGKFKDNRHVAVDGNGRIYSADYSGGRIQVFDSSGKFITQWTAEAGMNLYDMAADRKGNLFIANNKGLFQFEGETGKLLQKVENIQFNGLSILPDGTVVAVGRNGIAFYDSSLKLIRDIKDAGQQASATFGFEKVSVDGNGTIYTLDRHTKDVCKFSADGKFLNRFSSNAGSPNAIAIDPKGRLFVSDTSNVNVLDENGRAVKAFKAYQAFGMAFNDDGELFIASRPFVVKSKLNF